MCNKSIADKKRHAWMESQLATLATDTGTTFAKLFQVEGIQTILFKFWAFRVYTLNNLTPIRLFCVKSRFSGLSGIKTDHVWPEIRPLGFKGLKHLGLADFLITRRGNFPSAMLTVTNTVIFSFKSFLPTHLSFLKT